MIHGLSHLFMFIPFLSASCCRANTSTPFLPSMQAEIAWQYAYCAWPTLPTPTTDANVSFGPIKASKPGLQRVWADKVPNNHIYLHGIQPHWNSTPTKSSNLPQTQNLLNLFELIQKISAYSTSDCWSCHVIMSYSFLNPSKAPCQRNKATETTRPLSSLTEWADCHSHRDVKCATSANWITPVRPLLCLANCPFLWYTMSHHVVHHVFPPHCAVFRYVSIPRCRRCHQLQCLLPLRRLPLDGNAKMTETRETTWDSAMCQNIRKYPKISENHVWCWCRETSETWNDFDMFRFRLRQLLQSSGKFRPCGRSQCQPVKAGGRGWLGDDRTENIGSEIFSSDCQDFSSDCSNDSESFRSLRGKIRYRVSKPDFQTSNSWFPYSISSQHLAQSSWELPTLRVTASASTASEDAALGDRDTKWYEGFEHPIGDTKNSSAKQIGDGRRQSKISNIDYSWLFCQSAVSESHDESSAIACAEAPSNSKWNISVVVLKKG